MQRVLAKTRQAVNIQNAATYHKSGEVTKAMLELSKALNNNSVCRTPAMVMLSREVRGKGGAKGLTPIAPQSHFGTRLGNPKP